jgi:hypothetical protein
VQIWLDNIWAGSSSSEEADTRAEPWKIFPRQEFAFQWADSQAGVVPKNLAYFSFEDSKSGTRKFLISSYEEFWRRYLKVRDGERHYYEIIREGTPCHLYFDIEFCRVANPTVDGVAAVKGLMELVRATMEERFQLSFSDENLAHMDSSTRVKFSCHVVIQIPGAAFESAIQCGGFVK